MGMYCRDAEMCISWFGRATRKAWKKAKPEQYIYFGKHAPSPFETELMVHVKRGVERSFSPSYEDKNTKDWIVYYSY